jgi:HK97 family phage portal protein
MSLFNRLFGAREKKENPAYRAILSTIGRGQAIWTPRDYANLSKAGYQNCATVFACVSKVAKGASRIDWTLGRVGGDEVEEHPLLKLLARPNEFEGGSRLVEKVLSYLLLAGNSYVLGVRGAQSQPPVYLYSLRPDRMTIVAGTWKEPVSRYEYSTGIVPEKFEMKDVLHLLEFHPTNDFYGLSRLEVAARAIDISNKSMEWNKKLLDNDMRPSGIIKLDPALAEEQFNSFVTRFNDQYMGHGNAGSVPIFNGGVEWQSTSLSPKDIDWSVGQKEIMRSICTIFDVPSQLLGDTENTTYSNMQEARKALYMEAILPLMDLYRDELNAWLTPYFGDGLKLDYDRDGIEALQEEQAKKYVYLQASDWLTVNEKRVATGYDEVGPEGDVILVGLGKIPLEEAVAEPEPVPDVLKPFAGGKPGNGPEPDEKPPKKPADEAVPEDEEAGAGAGKKAATGRVGAKAGLPAAKSSFWTHLERKERLWLSFEQRVKSREKSFESIAKGYLERQAKAIRDRAASASSLSVLKAEDLLNVKDEAKKYVKTFWPWYRDHFIRAGNAGVRATKGELFDDAEFKADDPTSWVFEMTPELESALRDLVFNSGTKVNQTAIEKIYSVLKDANATNMTVSEFAADIYEKCGTLERWRAMLWARTESVKVDSFGELEGYRETEFVEKKGWLSAMTPTSRDAHIDADGQEVLLDDDFSIGGEALAYPGDPKASVGNIANCLCTMYPIVGEAGG